MRDYPGINQSGVVPNDVHRQGGRHAVKIARGNDITAHFGGLSRQLREFPGIDETVRPLVFWALVPSLCEQLQRLLDQHIRRTEGRIVRGCCIVGLGQGWDGRRQC